MLPRLELAFPVNPRHLYRHLVREASYLPGICKPYVKTRIRDGFGRAGAAIAKHARRKVQSQTQTRPRETSENQETPDPARKALQHGLRHLRALRAVNLGDLTRLDRLLHQVFAKMGRRRRELLTHVLHPDPALDSAALRQKLEAQQANPPLDARGRPLPRRRPDGWDSKKVLSFVEAQYRQQLVTDTAVWSRIGTLSPLNPKRERAKLPALGIWGKPIPERRVRTLMEKWWKTAASRLAPPLDKAEWETIRAAGTGALPEEEWKPAPRRTVARSGPAESTPAATPAPAAAASPWDWTPLASASASRLGRPVIRRQWRLTGKLEAGPYALHRRPPRGSIPSRTLRRSYDRIWQASSYVERDMETSSLKAIHWGGAGTELPLPVATSADARIFVNSEAVTSSAPLGRAIRKFSPKAQAVLREPEAAESKVAAPTAASAGAGRLRETSSRPARPKSPQQEKEPKVSPPREISPRQTPSKGRPSQSTSSSPKSPSKARSPRETSSRKSSVKAQSTATHETTSRETPFKKTPAKHAPKTPPSPASP